MTELLSRRELKANLRLGWIEVAVGAVSDDAHITVACHGSFRAVNCFHFDSDHQSASVIVTQLSYAETDFIFISNYQQIV